MPPPARSCGPRRSSTTSRARSSPRRRWWCRTWSSPASAAANTARAAACRPTTSTPARSLEDLDRARPRRTRQRQLEGRQLAARRRAAVAGRLLRRQDRHRVLGHQQSRARGTPAVRSTGDGNYGKLTNLYSSSTVALRRRHRQDQVAHPGHARRRLGLRRRQRTACSPT